MKKTLSLLFLAAWLLMFSPAGFAQRVPGTWTEKSANGVGRFWSFSFALDGKVYGGTGRPQFSSLTPLNDFWEYDIATDTWTQKANYPGGNREGATGFTAQGRVFAGFGSPFIQFTKDLYEFLPDSNKWVQKASVPGIGFAFSHGFVIDSMYYIGPENGTNQVYAYNVNTDTWTTVAPFPGNDRRAQVSFSLKGKGYIGMGAGVFSGVYGDFWSYDPVADTWTQVADIFPKSDQSTAFSVGDYGYVANAGGSGGGGKDTYRYDPVNDLWEYEATLPGDRIANATSCALDSTGYLLYGERTISGGNISSSAVYQFVPGTDGGGNTGIRRPAFAFPAVRLLSGTSSLAVEMEPEFVPAEAILTLSDLSGKACARVQGQLPGRIELPVGTLAPGVYVLSLQLPGLPLYTQKWVRQ